MNEKNKNKNYSLANCLIYELIKIHTVNIKSFFHACSLHTEKYICQINIKKNSRHLGRKTKGLKLPTD